MVPPNNSEIAIVKHPFLEDTSVVNTISNIPGSIAGNPALSSDDRYIYLTHNEEEAGRMSVYDSTGKLWFMGRSEDIDPHLEGSVKSSGWAPLGIARSPVPAKQFPGVNEKHDFVAWTRLSVLSPNSMGASKGYRYAFTLPSDFDGSGELDMKDGIVPLGNNTWRMSTGPVFGNKGRNMFCGVSQSQYRGWVSKRLNIGFSWARRHLERIMGDIASPMASPTLSVDESVLFGSVAHPTRAIAYAINSNDGEIVWESLGSVDATMNSEAKITRDGERVYFVEDGGNVLSKNTLDGSDFWAFPVIVGSDFASVSAPGEFSLSPDEATLYYATNDRDGEMVTINALMVRGDPISQAPSTNPSAAPSPHPSTNPSGTPSTNPSASPSAFPSMSPSVSPSTNPSAIPSVSPSMSPSTSPSVAPSTSPSVTPSTNPSATPSNPSSSYYAWEDCCSHDDVTPTLLVHGTTRKKGRWCAEVKNQKNGLWLQHCNAYVEKQHFFYCQCDRTIRPTRHSKFDKCAMVKSPYNDERLFVAPCRAIVDENRKRFDFNNDGSITLSANPNLCVTNLGSGINKDDWIKLKDCVRPVDPRQDLDNIWTLDSLYL